MNKNNVYNAWNINVLSVNDAEVKSKDLEKISGGINKRMLSAAGIALITMFMPATNVFSTSVNASSENVSTIVSTSNESKEKSSPKVLKIPKVEWMISKKSNESNKLIWYKGEKAINSDRVKYYKTKNAIAGDPFKAFDEQGDSLFIEVTDESEIKDIQEIDAALRKSAEKSLEMFKKRYENALTFKLKTMDEFKKLSKDEKLEYLLYRDSDVTKKMLCHPDYPTVFTSKAVGYYTNFDKRANEYFKSLKGLSPEQLQMSENKELYEEYLNCQDCKYYLNKFAQDSEIEAIYQITLDVLKEIFEESTI